jgi:hypothetical protein
LEMAADTADLDEDPRARRGRGRGVSKASGSPKLAWGKATLASPSLPLVRGLQNHDLSRPE